MCNCLGELHNELIRLLRVLKFPIKLESLAQTEQHLLSHLGGSNFDSFGHGTFLEFLTKHESILTALGGNTIRSDGGRMSEKQKKRRDEVLVCLRQLKDLSNHVSIIHVHVNYMCTIVQ